MANDLKPCPFCGGSAVIQHDAGSYGYRRPTVWIACENQPFENPHRKKWDVRKHHCFARTKAFDEERWEQGKGTFSIAEKALSEAIAAWNRRDDTSARAEGHAAGMAEATALIVALRAAINSAIAEIESGRLYDRMCCDGHHCGCQGSSNAEFLIWNLRQTIKASAHLPGEDAA